MERRYHRELAKKYEFAAKYPWLPVMPDPPEGADIGVKSPWETE